MKWKRFFLLAPVGSVLGLSIAGYYIRVFFSLPHAFELNTFDPLYYLFVWKRSGFSLTPPFLDCLSIIFGSGFCFCLLGVTIGATSKSGASTHGSAKWATEREVGESLKSHNGVILGKDSKGNYLKHDGPEHVLLVAPTRSGKGTSVIVPTLLTWSESVIIYDPKGENFELTAGKRLTFSNVIYFNPTRLGTAKFNPLLEVRKGTEEVSDAQIIAEILVPEEKHGSEHWVKDGRILITAAILHCLYEKEEPPTLGRVADLLFGGGAGGTFESALEHMRNYQHLSVRPHPMIVSAATSILKKSDEERSGVRSTVTANLSLFLDPVVRNAVGGSDFRVADLVNGDFPLSVYLVIPISQMDKIRPLFRIMLDCISRKLTDSLEFERKEKWTWRFDRRHCFGLKARKESSVRSKLPKHRLLFLLDEFPGLGKIPFFESSLAFIAGYGLKALLICQSKNQIDSIYGDKSSIPDNCQVQIVFRPDGLQTQEWISRRLGETTLIHRGISRSGAFLSFVFKSRSISEQHIKRSLLTSGEIGTLGMDEEIIFAGGKNIRAKKAFFYEDAALQQGVALTPPSICSEGQYSFGPKWVPCEWETIREKVNPPREKDLEQLNTTGISL